MVAESMGVCLTTLPECVVELPCFRFYSFNSSTKPNFLRRINAAANSNRLKRRRLSIACSVSTQTAGFEDSSPSTRSVGDASAFTGGGGGGGGGKTAVEDDFSHVTKFKMSDFSITDRVSIGLTSRADEIIFEATVKDINSPLYDTKVVLRRLISAQAKRRGRRAIEVFKRLACRRVLYHSYSMQVYGYVCSSTTDDTGSFTLVHGYHGSFSLRHWLQQSDWLPTLEATLNLDEELARKVGDDTVGGPAASRQLRLIRILMRDLLIGVNYLHSHGFAHTELRLENLHISPVDKHVKVGILGNAADLNESCSENTMMSSNMDRPKMMIAFDMRCIGFIMAKMVLKELMDSSLFFKFKAFLTKGNDPSCLREFLLHTINKNSSSGNTGLQMLDRNWGAGWNLLSLLLATKPSERISCLKALRHPFLCGPRWKIYPSMDLIRWSLGSTAVRITEVYIYNQQQRSRLAHFIELMEMLNPCPKPRHWLELLPGKWRLLYSTCRQIGLSLRQPRLRVLIGDVFLTVSKDSKQALANFSFVSDVDFTVIVGHDWPHNKVGVGGTLRADSLFGIKSGRRIYLKEEDSPKRFPSPATSAQNTALKVLSGKKWKKIIPIKDYPSTLPVAKLISSDVEITIRLDERLSSGVLDAQKIIHEVRTQIPPEIFDLSRIVCGTYVDSRLLVLRSVSGSALIFTRSCN